MHNYNYITSKKHGLKWRYKGSHGSVEEGAIKEYEMPLWIYVLQKRFWS